eukprot:jgi/Chrpa1/18806/Chrysochromulina_OHIO_Genome00004951-RA
MAATDFAPTEPMRFLPMLSDASFVSLLLWMASQTALTPSSLRSLDDKSRAVSPPVTATIAATAFAPTGLMPFFLKLSDASLVSLLFWMALQTALTPSSSRQLEDKFRAVSAPVTFRLGYQLATCRANVLTGHVHTHDLAVLVAADGGKDGTPALILEIVATEPDGRQGAVDAKHVCHMLSACFPANSVTRQIELLERLVLFESLADGFCAQLLQLVPRQGQLHQRACDGHHSRHSVCSNWTNAIVLEVERRELGLLVFLDGLADCAYALIFEAVIGQIQGRQPAIDAQSVGNRRDALCSISSLAIFIEAAQLVSGEVRRQQDRIGWLEVFAGEVSSGLVAPDAAERDTLLLGNFSEHLGGLRIKLIAQEVGHRQPAFDTDQAGDHNRMGTTKLLAR